MVAIKLKFWSPPKVDREREKEWKSSDVWRQKLLTTKLLRPSVQQIMFNTILIYRSAEKYLYSKVSPNIDIKTFHVAINTLNHLIFSHHTLCHHTLWLIIWLMINKFSKFFFPFFFFNRLVANWWLLSKFSLPNTFFTYYSNQNSCNNM